MTDSVRIIQFPEAGEGVELFFRNRDKLSLQNTFGDEWFLGAADRLQRFDMAFVEECLRVGGKKDGKPHKIDLDDLDSVIMAVIAQRVLDALYLSMHGKTFEDHVKWIIELAETEAKAAEDKANADSPQPGPASSSAGSDEPLSGPASRPKRSGK